MGILLGGFFIWLLCAVIASAAASGRGLNGCLWFAIGFFLGPFGVLLALLWPANRPVQVAISSADDVEPGARIVCPNCRSFVPAAATICRYCQTRLVPPSRRPDQSP